MGVMTSGRAPMRLLGALEFLDGSIGQTLGDIGPSQHHVGVAEVGIEIEHLSKLGEGVVVATGEIVDQAKVRAVRSATPGRDRAPLGEFERLLVPPQQAR